jgi:MFS family permease
MVGGVLAAYAIPQILLRIPMGIWSDRLGRRKPVVAAGIIFTSLGALGLGLSSTPWLLFLSRIATGIGAAAWVVFPLYFSAYYPENDSGKAFGLINFVQSIALIAATAGGGFIAEAFGLNRPFFVAALLGIFALLALTATRESPLTRMPAASLKNSLSIAARPLLITVSVMAILLHFAIFTGTFGFIPIYAADIGASSSQLGLIAMINLGFSALGTLAAVRIRQQLGYRTTIIFSALLISASLFSIPFIESIPLLMAIQVSCGLGSGILMTLFMVLSVRGLPPQQQATAMGVYQAIYAVGMLAGPLVSGFLGGGSGLSVVFYLAAFCILLVAAAAFLPLFSRRIIG